VEIIMNMRVSEALKLWLLTFSLSDKSKHSNVWARHWAPLRICWIWGN
jgi:hypothetical protein